MDDSTQAATTWPPDREPRNVAEAREWLLTHPTASLCSCQGVGSYLCADGLTWRDCPHHARKAGAAARKQATIDDAAAALGLKPAHLHDAVASLGIKRGGGGR